MGRPNVIVRKTTSLGDENDEDFKTSCKMSNNDGIVRSSSRIRTKRSIGDATSNNNSNSGTTTPKETAPPAVTATSTSDENSNSSSSKLEPPKRLKLEKQEESQQKVKEEKVKIEDEEKDKEEEDIEEDPCPDCDRVFKNYFSLMRHIAFVHRRDKTMELMKLKKIKTGHHVVN